MFGFQTKQQYIEKKRETLEILSQQVEELRSFLNAGQASLTENANPVEEAKNKAFLDTLPRNVDDRLARIMVYASQGLSEIKPFHELGATSDNLVVVKQGSSPDIGNIMRFPSNEVEDGLYGFSNNK